MFSAHWQGGTKITINDSPFTCCENFSRKESEIMLIQLGRFPNWSGIRESNPSLHLGKVMLSQSTNPA